MPKTTDTNEPLKRAELGKRVERLTTTGVFETRDAAPQETEDGQRIYWTLAYAEGVEDRHNTIIDHRAFANVTVDDFRILTHHDQTSDPVGKPVALDYDERGLWVGTVYAPTARGQEVETLVRDGYFRAVSVGFIPVDGYKRKADGVTVFTRCELLELSLVNCPSSKGALFDLARNFDADPAALEEIYADVLRAVTPEEEAAELLTSKRIFLEDVLATRAAENADLTETLGLALSLVGAIDSVADVLMELISDALGVENPDDAQDEALEASDVDGDEGTSEGLMGTPLENAATVTTAEKASARSVLRRTRRR